MASKSPLHFKLYEELAARIHSGEWKQGEQVPSENSLTEEFGVSRGPVRQALARLRSEGLIVGGRGVSPRVQKAVPAQSFDTYVSFTEWAEELGFEPRQKTIEVKRMLADEAIAGELQIAPGEPVVFVLRVRMFDDEPVMLERGTYPIESGRHLLAADLDTSSIYQILRENDVYPISAKNIIDAVAATEQEAKWMGVAPGAPLLRVRRSSFDEHGDVVDVVDNRYLPTKANFAVGNARGPGGPLARVAAGPSPA